MKGHDVALVELSVRVGELRGAGFEPWRPVLTLPAADEPVVIVGAPLQADARLAFLRAAACRLEGRAPLVLEYTGTGRSSTHGMPRHPGGQLGVAGHLAPHRTPRGSRQYDERDVPWYTACQIDSPCEPTGVNAEQPENTSYATPLVGVDRCFVGGDFDMEARSFRSDPGIGIRHSAGNLGQPEPAPRQRTADSSLADVERPACRARRTTATRSSSCRGLLPRSARLRRGA